MNLLVPDSWLREFLKTKATPKQIKEYLSLCGPSVERMHTTDNEVIYDIEVTSNRPDSMSVVGIAREAAATLPRFGIPAKLAGDPYAEKVRPFQASGDKKLSIKADSNLCPRWASVVMDNVKVGPSPKWLKDKLEATGIRSLNNIIDITNYLMRSFGQPAHAFDYDEIKDATMILRASKKGEKITTLDGKTHTLAGGDIVIEDGSGQLVDLCGIMGGENSAIHETTKTVILFLQTYNSVRIRRTMMALAHRTEAGSLFEKGTDPELVLPAMRKGTELMAKLSGGRVASRLYDLYPKPYQPYTVSVSRTKVDAYLGTRLSDKEISTILTSLGFEVIIPGLTRNPSLPKTGSRHGGRDDMIHITVPSFRRDITIDVDIIEELARIRGYHHIASTLPDTAPPMTKGNVNLAWEEEIKIRLRDWGYTELYTYSMISDRLMDIFGLEKTKAYKITNPLSDDWVYMRPNLLPSVLSAVSQNLSVRSNLTLFELSAVYRNRRGDLPEEIPHLAVTWTGDSDGLRTAKGLTEALFQLLGIPFPKVIAERQHPWYQPGRMLKLADYGILGEVETTLLEDLGIKKPVIVLDLDVAKLAALANPRRTYTPISKYPPMIEDFSFTVSSDFTVGSLIDAIKSTHPLIADVSLLSLYKTTRTLRVTYLDRTKNLTDEDVRPVREKLIAVAEKLGAALKT